MTSRIPEASEIGASPEGTSALSSPWVALEILLLSPLYSTLSLLTSCLSLLASGLSPLTSGLSLLASGPSLLASVLSPLASVLSLLASVLSLLASVLSSFASSLFTGLLSFRNREGLFSGTSLLIGASSLRKSVASVACSRSETSNLSIKSAFFITEDPLIPRCFAKSFSVTRFRDSSFSLMFSI